MAFGSSSASVSMLKSHLGTQGASRSVVERLGQQTRCYASVFGYGQTASSSYNHGHGHAPPRKHDSPTGTTPAAAQRYLTKLLSLPPARQFPEPLALQILTHKSYRFSHPVRFSPESTTAESSAPHNARLSFVGRRAMTMYLTVFVHEAYGSVGTMRAQGLDFLKDKSLEERLIALGHVNNLGRMVGGEWGLEDVMRWDENQTSVVTGNVSVKGQTVAAIIGGVFTHFGSPAAHRMFHSHIFPRFISQLRDTSLVEKVETTRAQLEKEFGSGILPRE